MSICARTSLIVALSMSRSARSTAASKRCRRTPNAAAASSSRGQQVVFERFHQRFDQPGSSPATAAATTDGDRGQVEAQPRARAGRSSSRRRSARASPRSSWRPARRCPTRGRRARGATVAAAARNSSTSRPSIGCVRLARQAGSGEHRQALDQPHEEAERARAGGDDDRGAQRDRLRHGVQQRLLDRQPRGEVARERAVVRAAGRRGRRSGARRRRSRRREAPRPGGARRRRTLPRRALHRVDQVVGDLDAVQRRVEPRAGRGVAEHEVVERAPAAATRSRERAKPRTAWPVAQQARHERGADVARDAGDEGLQAARDSPQADTHRKHRRLRERHPANGEENAPCRGLFAGRARNPCVLRDPAPGEPLHGSPPLRFDRRRSCDGVVNEGVLEACPQLLRRRAPRGRRRSRARSASSRATASARSSSTSRARPSGPITRRACARRAAALRVPPGAPAPGRVGVPYGSGAGRAATVSDPVRRPACRSARGRGSTRTRTARRG